MICENEIKRFLAWRVKHIPDRAFIIFLSAVTGFVSGLSAMVLKNSVYLIRSLLSNHLVSYYSQYFYFLLPVVGILLAILVAKYIVRQRVGHGIPGTLYAISKRNGYIRPHHMYSSIITSALTVGFGGSVGLEGPTVATGAAIGSNISRWLHLEYKTTILLIGCASAGAMASIFNAPIAAIIFAIEVIMLDLTMSSMVPLLISAITASLTSYFITGNEILFHSRHIDPFYLRDVPYIIVLGIISGLVSLYFKRVYLAAGKLFDKMGNIYLRVLVGGGLLGVVIFLFPPLYGEGYFAINQLIAGGFNNLFAGSIFAGFQNSQTMIVLFFVLLALIKVIATSLTFGAGGVGGIFAPSLFIGSCLGFVSGYIINISGIHQVSILNFTLLGMAGALSGILFAPLTAIFLIAEVTGGYELFLPLMITSVIAYMTIRFFESHSVYTTQLAQRGELITHHKDKAVLSRMNLESVIETNFITLNPENTLGELVNAIKTSRRNIFPVVDQKGIFLGLVPLDNVRDIIFEPEFYEKVNVMELMIDPPMIINTGDTMEEVVEKLKETGMYNLAVVDKGKYIGFVSRANIFNIYRSLLIEFSEH